MLDDTLAPDAVPYTTAALRKAGIDPPPSPATLARWRLRGLSGVRMPTHLRRAAIFFSCRFGPIFCGGYRNSRRCR